MIINYINISLKYFLLVLIGFSKCLYLKDGNNSNIIISKLAFGSCFNGFGYKRFEIFESILNNNPDIFVWLGDVAYLDEFNFSLIFGSVPPFSKENAIKKFDETYNEKHYSLFRNKTFITGIWDDHDYSYNNAKKGSPYKQTVKELFLNFLETPKDSVRRTTDEKGIYTSFSIGESYKKVKIILLDLRYEQTERTDSEENMMSEEQWEWLDNELSTGNETYTIIGSGIQFLNNIGFSWTEKWYNSSRIRLFELIAKHKRQGVFIISGDVHRAEVSVTPCIHSSNYIYYNKTTIFKS